MQLCSIDDFSKRLKKNDKRPLRTISIELTRRCNFGCVHCFCAKPNLIENSTNELGYDDWNSIFEQCSAEGGLFLTVTGGEPLLHKDFKRIWRNLKQKGFLITLFTNGSLLNEDIADFLAQWTPAEVSVTLYGASEETYQNVTGCKNQFKRVIDSLDILSEKKIKLEVKGVFSHLNKHDFKAVKEISRRYCDLFRWDVELVGGFPGCKRNPQDIRLSPKEIVEMESQEPVRNKTMQNLIDEWVPSSVSINNNNVFRCNVGNGGVHIDAYGGMHPCLLMESLKYDLTSGSVKEGWKKAIPEMLKTLPFQPGPCQDCEAVEICGQCVAFALLEGCPAAGPVPFRCGLVKARAEKYGIGNKIMIPKKLE